MQENLCVVRARIGIGRVVGDLDGLHIRQPGNPLGVATEFRNRGSMEL